MAMIKGLPVTEPSSDGIQAALGLSGYTDYAVLIRPDLYGPKQDIVKFWAKWQPMHSTKLHKLTDAERAAAGYGIKDNTNYEYTDNTDISDAFNNAKNGVYSLYREKPSGGINTSPFRPWDYFNEAGTMSYNNEAICPFSFDLEEITDRGFAQITARALMDNELPDANITIRDLQNVGGANSIISLNDSATCFGLLYTKDGGSVQVLGTDGKYPAFNGPDSERTNDLQLVGDGAYKFAYIILNTASKRFITLPYPVQEVTVTSTGLTKGYIEVYGEYEYNTAGTQITIKNLTVIPRGADAVAGTVGIYICDVSTSKENVESSAIASYAYDYPATAKDAEYIISDKTIPVSGYNVENITPWAVTTTAAGEVYKTPLDWIDNSGELG